MTNNLAPTDGELLFWMVLLIAALIWLFRNLLSTQGSDNKIDDMAAWSRNYDKLQRRR